MYPFDYQRPTTLSDATEAYVSGGESAFLAGGQSLIPAMKLRMASHDRLVDLRRLPGLDGIRREGDRLIIGALATHETVSESAEVAAAIPALAALVGSIGDPSVRHMGTLGGSVANNDPAADYPAALLALGGTIRTDRREVSAADFFGEFFDTALEPGEIVTECHFPIPQAAGYAKVRNPASRYAVVGVFVARLADGPRVAVTGAGPKVFRQTAMEEALAAEFAPRALEEIKMTADGLNHDMHASAEYRAHLVGVLAKRATAQAIGA